MTQGAKLPLTLQRKYTSSKRSSSRQIETSVAVEIVDDDADQLAGVEHVDQVLLGRIEAAVAAAEIDLGRAVVEGDHDVGLAVDVAGRVGSERRG